ncbi:cation-translocating P-type ATPase C-terminal domain-containing protein [Coprobacillaceae bacterium CR2/5/TPMF4]|nr:cation-translocating P-type ATPase C-terminal domain-containing protein [Coprobacillaceae bacterium CR2/5/TPMF4]
MLLLIVYVPFLNGVFGTAPLGIYEWLYLIPIPFILFGIEELRKKIVRKRKNKGEEYENNNCWLWEFWNPFSEIFKWIKS